MNWRIVFLFNVAAAICAVPLGLTATKTIWDSGQRSIAVWVALLSVSCILRCIVDALTAVENAA